jgi:hypothetical protein
MVQTQPKYFVTGKQSRRCRPPAGGPPKLQPRTQAGRAAARGTRGSQAHKRAPGATGARPARTTPSRQPTLPPRRPAAQSSAEPTSQARHPERPPRDDIRIVIGHHDHLHLAHQADPSHRVNHRHQRAPPLHTRITVASPRDTPLPVPMKVLLLHGTPSPKRIRGTFLHHEPTRRTSFYAA